MIFEGELCNGHFDPKTGACVACPDGFTYNSISKTCELPCGNNQEYNPTTEQCQCISGYMNDPATNTCIPSMPVPVTPELTPTCPDGSQGVRDLTTGEFTCLGNAIKKEDLLEPCPYGQYWVNVDDGLWWCQQLSDNTMEAERQCKSNGLLYDADGDTCKVDITNIPARE